MWVSLTDNVDLWSDNVWISFLFAQCQHNRADATGKVVTACVNLNLIHVHILEGGHSKK